MQTAESPYLVDGGVRGLVGGCDMRGYWTVGYDLVSQNLNALEKTASWPTSRELPPCCLCTLVFWKIPKRRFPNRTLSAKQGGLENIGLVCFFSMPCYGNIDVFAKKNVFFGSLAKCLGLADFRFGTCQNKNVSNSHGPITPPSSYFLPPRTHAACPEDTLRTL